MTASVPDQTSFESTGDGVNLEFSFPLRFLENADVLVYVDGVLQVLGTHYSLEGAGEDSGGIITFEADYAPALGATVRRTRATAPKQTVDLADSGRTPGNTLEKQLDRLAMAAQDHESRIENIGGLADELDAAVATAGTSATAAAVSAAAASTSEINAAASEAAAETARAEAEQWAEEDEDVPVALGQYSAKHHALKAAASAAAAEATTGLRLPSYTFASRPDPSPAGQRILVTDERYGAVQAYSDGTYWRRVSDRRVVQSASVNYYIDGTSGNDASVGTSSATAIKTLTQLKALVAALPSYRRSGLWFKFKRGTSIAGYWTLDANNFGCRFEAYGTESLARPIFDCADVLTNASFTVDGTYANCYNITINPVLTGSAAAEWPGIWVDGVRYSYVATKAECDAAPYNFTHPNPADQTSLVITINSGSNPTSDGKVYEASIRASAIDTVAAEECEFRDLHGKRNYGSYGPFALGKYAIAERLLLEDGNTHNIYFEAYSVLRDVEALNCNPGAGVSATMFIGFGNPVQPEARARLERCVARCSKNTTKAPSTITAVTRAGTTSVTVSAGHKFVVGDYVTGVGVGGATWLNGVRWYVSAVATNTLTLQKHDYTVNRVQGYNSSAEAAWTSGGVIQLVPFVANVTGFYSHGPSDGTNVWDEIIYDRCESHGCATGFSAADVRKAVVIEPYCTQFFIGFDVAAYAKMIVKGGKSENVPAVVGALASRLAANSEMEIVDHPFTINSTGNHQISGDGKLKLRNVDHIGFSSLIRGLGANETVFLRRIKNSPNANVTQSNLFNFNSSTTGLSLDSDNNDFGSYAGDFVITGTTLTGLAGYRAGTGQDLNSKP